MKAALPKMKDVRGRFADGFYELEIPPNFDPFQVARALEKTGEFDELMFNVFVRVDATPNDTQYPNQWNMPRILMPYA